MHEIVPVPLEDNRFKIDVDSTVEGEVDLNTLYVLDWQLIKCGSTSSMQVASLQAELDMVQAQLADRHAAAAAHQLQQQQQHQQQMGGLSFSPGQAHDYMQQQFDQPSELNMQQPGPTSALSMSLASSSDSAHNYLRIKEEETRPYHAGMQQHDFQYGIMLSNPLEPMPHQALIDSMERPRSGALSDHQPADHDGELQALAHSLLRRPK
jgi:hypothetical protein